MKTEYQEIINSFVDAYGLTRGEVIAEIERTFSSMLSRWYGMDVVALFTGEQLKAVGYYRNSSSELIQKPIELSLVRGWNTIKRILDKNLSKSASIKEATKLKKKEHQTLWGEIIKTNQENDLIVELDNEPGFPPLIATCPIKYIGKHERHEITVGERRAFHLRRVELLQMKDAIRLQITVDRVSKNLVSGIIKSKLVNGGTRVHCFKRYVGHKAFVEVNNFIPKKVIKETSREIGEHIQVKIKK